MTPSVLPSDHPSPFEPGELADRALQAHRIVLFERWATLRAATSALVGVTILAVVAAILWWPYSMAGVMMAIILVGVSGPRLVAARMRWQNFPFRYEKLSLHSDERRTPGGAVALLVGGAVVSAAITGFRSQRWWVALLGGLGAAVLLLPATVPFFPSWEHRGRIADRELAEHPERIQVIAALAGYPQAPWELPAWLARWRAGTPPPPPYRGASQPRTPADPSVFRQR